jgi:hypothetical protein
MKLSDIFKQYIWLADTIYRAGNITLQELNDRWVKTEISGGLPMNRITFNRHRISIEEIFGLCIECKRKSGYVYYIDNAEVLKGNSVQKWILDSFSVGNLLSGNLSLKNRILLENIPSGKIYLQSVIDAMRKGHKLRMSYQHFRKTEGYTIIVEPYAVKVFKQRWYLVVNNPKYQSYTVYAFDRIVSLEETSETFHVSEDFDAESVFKDSYGIICGTQTDVQRIRIRAYYPLVDYLRTLPWHSSQKELCSTPEYAEFEFRLRPTFDFRQEILSQGNEVEVLEPLSFREEVAKELKAAMERYL